MANITTDTNKAAAVLSSINLKKDFDAIQKLANRATIWLVCDEPDTTIANMVLDCLFEQGAPALAKQFAAYMAARTGCKYSAKEMSITVPDGTVLSETNAADWHSKACMWNLYKAPKDESVKVCKYLQDATRLKDKIASAKAFASKSEEAQAIQFARDLELLIIKHRNAIADLDKPVAKPAKRVRKAKPANPANVTELPVANAA